jgi:hypothetical protein
MKAVGLIPSDTGVEGGKETGQRVTHYVRQGGPFDRACAELLKAGCTVAYVEAGPGHRRGNQGQDRPQESGQQDQVHLSGVRAQRLG